MLRQSSARRRFERLEDRSVLNGGSILGSITTILPAVSAGAGLNVSGMVQAGPVSTGINADATLMASESGGNVSLGTNFGAGVNANVANLVGVAVNASGNANAGVNAGSTLNAASGIVDSVLSDVTGLLALPGLAI